MAETRSAALRVSPTSTGALSKHSAEHNSDASRLGSLRLSNEMFALAFLTCCAAR